MKERTLVNSGTSVSRIVVTGMGVVTSIGETVPAFWSGLMHGRCGIGPVEGIDTAGLEVRVAAQIKQFDAPGRLAHWKHDKTILHSDRYSWLAAAAADEAIRQSGLEVRFAQPYRVACIIGSAAGGQVSGEKGCRDRFADNKRAVHPMFLPRIIASSATAHVAIEYGIKGPAFAVCSAGATSAHAIALGSDYIRHGLVDVAIVGGADSPITYGVLLASQSLNLLSPEGCFPFSGKRRGTVLAEGAGVLVLESEQHVSKRGGTILAEVCGIGLTSNARDMVTPEAGTMGEAMRRAISDARLQPCDIDYVNAHGTGTRLNDIVETETIKQVFGAHARAMGVSSTKSMHGHALGAAAAIEAIASIEAMRNGWMPPTIGLNESDPECDLDYVPIVGRKKDLRYTMSSSFGLGGFNSILVFGVPSS
jgi:nodulation protein E